MTQEQKLDSLVNNILSLVTVCLKRFRRSARRTLIFLSELEVLKEDPSPSEIELDPYDGYVKIDYDLDDQMP